MRTAVLTVLASLAVTSAHGQQILTLPPESAMPKFYVLPPAQYDKEFDGRVIIARRSGSEMKVDCPFGQDQPVVGCAYGGPKSVSGRFVAQLCVIYVLEDQELITRGQRYDLIVRHEVAHCNGWSGNHEDAVYYQPEK